MDRGVGAAARLLSESDRKDLAFQALTGSETLSDLAARHGVSRKFVHRQAHKGKRGRFCGAAGSAGDTAGFKPGEYLVGGVPLEGLLSGGAGGTVGGLVS